MQVGALASSKGRPSWPAARPKEGPPSGGRWNGGREEKSRALELRLGRSGNLVLLSKEN